MDLAQQQQLQQQQHQQQQQQQQPLQQEQDKQNAKNNNNNNQKSKTELNTIIIQNNQNINGNLNQKHEGNIQTEQNNNIFANTSTGSNAVFDMITSLLQLENAIAQPQNNINKIKNEQNLGFTPYNSSSLTYPTTIINNKNGINKSQKNKLSSTTTTKILNNSFSSSNQSSNITYTNSPLSSINNINLNNNNNNNTISTFNDINYASLYNSKISQYNQELQQNMLMKEDGQEILGNKKVSMNIPSKQIRQQDMDLENSEENGQEEKQEEKKNDPKETHNIIQQVIPLFIDRFKARCSKDIPLPESFLKLLERRSLTKSLQYFNQICQAIQEETIKNNLPLKQIAYQIFEYDLAQWARNSKNISTACLYFKYQSAFILILNNPGLFSSIKVARKAHSDMKKKFLCSSPYLL